MTVAIEAYAQALAGLDVSNGCINAAEAMQVLLTRETVARSLTDADALNPPAFSRLTQLDQKLKKSAVRIDAAVGRACLAGWRVSFRPAAGAWWWSLDEIAAAEPPSSPLWSILAGACITLALSLAAEISKRFLSVGADFFSVFSTLAQGLLAVLAGSAFSQVGRDWMERVLGNMRIEVRFRDRWKLWLALGLLTAVVALRLSLPAVARAYNNLGVESKRQGRVTKAIDSFQRALSLNPDYVDAQYNLAAAHEDALEYDQAMIEYKRAILGDDRFYPAYNNLARLYLLRHNDSRSALELLDRAIRLNPPEDSVRQSLLKNRGWAKLIQQHLNEAERDLRDALAIKRESAAAHCLLAQVLEAEKRSSVSEWEACVAFAVGDGGDEAIWVSLAREHLQGRKP